MLFNKSLQDITFEDIEILKNNQIEESGILDYKTDYLGTPDHENNVLKEITAFANSGGGFLIYGIIESGRGGYPEKIEGINNNINLERLEQIIISNIRPRISVKFRKIPIPELDKCILVIFIPEGSNQPYYNNRVNKYYKRYNFEAKEMDEHEIEALYQKRFFGISKFNRYIEEAINYRKSAFPIEDVTRIMDGHIILAPLRFENKMFSSSEGMELGTNIQKKEFDSHGTNVDFIMGLVTPSKYGISWYSASSSNNVEVHRNAIVHFSTNYGTFDKQINANKFWDAGFGVNLLQTVELATIIYNKYEYNGKVKIMVKISNCLNSVLDDNRYSSRYKCRSEEITVEREWNSWDLESDKLRIGKSIMDEIYNHFGFWESRYFTVDGDEVTGYKT